MCDEFIKFLWNISTSPLCVSLRYLPACGRQIIKFGALIVVSPDRIHILTPPIENSFSLKGNYLPTYLCIWHFINVTLVSLKFINENRKISRKPVWRHSRTVLGIILLKKNQNFIDYFRRKVIFFEIFNLHFSTFWLFTYFQFQFILFWTNQFQIWKHQWIPQWMRFILDTTYTRICQV